MPRKKGPVAAHIEAQAEATPAEPIADTATDFPHGANELQARIETAMEAAPVTRASETEKPEPLAGRDWSKYADPNPRHSVRWPDGYEIAVQESPSRKTVEIQFGDGSARDKPQNHEAIREFLKGEGLRWNGTNAWVAGMEPPPRFESQAQKLERVGRNKELRARVEDEVFPAVVALEEERRGRVELTDETRQRIASAAEGRGR